MMFASFEQALKKQSVIYFLLVLSLPTVPQEYSPAGPSFDNVRWLTAVPNAWRHKRPPGSTGSVDELKYTWFRKTSLATRVIVVSRSDPC